MQTYTGGCHCGRVRYEVDTDLKDTMVCNCSHCQQKGFILHFTDADKFRLLTGEDHLTSYTFNKGKIDHLFCKVCGVESFARGVGFPKVMINVRCLDDVDIDVLSPRAYDGKSR